MQNDVRAVLQYVPRFRGKTFVVTLDLSRMGETAVAEALLDLAALQQVGLRLVVLSLGEKRGELADWLVDGEMKWQGVPDIADTERIRAVTERGQMAVVEGDGTWDPLGEEVTRLAVGLGAAKLIVFLAEALVCEDEPLHGISQREALARGGILAQAARLCEAGIPRIHLLDERRQGVLMDELFSNEGVGVMVHNDDYRRIRPLREEDVPELLAMIGRSVRRSHLVPRSYEEIEASLGDFLVMTVDENVVGCVALHRYGEGEPAEVACLYVKQAHEGLGYGILLVQAAEDKARELGLERVFALTNRASDYFTGRLGYRALEVTEIPEPRQRKLVESGRESVVVGKNLKKNNPM
ncbi:MAG: GNAT family N-acetyltransferase [Verrucomicrobiales bacterium]